MTPSNKHTRETSYWTEGGLDRYRMSMLGDNIDMSAICPYAYDTSRCAGRSNRHCFLDGESKKWTFDINFPKGGVGHGNYLDCLSTLRREFAKDNRCTVG